MWLEKNEKSTLEQLNIIKIGGNIIDQPEKLEKFLKDFSELQGHKILVHGGGKIATDLAKTMQIPQQMVEGRRVTNANTLQLITMVYGGLISKNIVAQLAAQGNAAIGLSGADANTVVSEKRPVKTVDYGFVGDVKKVNAEAIQKIVNAGFIPVFCAITHDEKGQLLNTNADTMASEIATALSVNFKTSLYYCFEKKGVLENVEDENSVIAAINPENYEQLKAEGKIFQGMIPKLDNAFSAIYKGVQAVHILQAEDLLATIKNKENHGTKITA